MAENEAKRRYVSEDIDDETKRIYVLDVVSEITFKKNSFEDKIKVLCKAFGKTQEYFGEVFGIARSSFMTRSQIGRFSIDEQRRIAEAVGGKLIAEFVFDDGFTCQGNMIEELVRGACEHAGINIAELSNRLGKTRQAVYAKIKNEKFTYDEVEVYAQAIGCHYHNAFLIEGIEI